VKLVFIKVEFPKVGLNAIVPVPVGAGPNKAPSEKGKRRNKERGPKSEPEEQNPEWLAKGQRNKQEPLGPHFLAIG
jgi:hypothetical protein